MRTTSLKVTSRGVVLFDYHLWRLAPECETVRQAFIDFASRAQPGCYRVSAQGMKIDIVTRGESQLHDYLPTRFACSPASQYPAQIFAKPASPSVFDTVRQPGIATLLTSADGLEAWESCSAALIGWDGNQYVCAPENRPRVASVTERALREHLSFREAPLLVNDSLPWALINAIKGVCLITLPGREAFPARATKAIEELMQHLTRRP